MWAATLIPIRHPRSRVHLGGYALCGAIGAKFAEPQRPVIAVDGDAVFQMHCQEIATLRENELSFVECVLDDMSLGSIRSTQIRSYEDEYSGQSSRQTLTSQKLQKNLVGRAKESSTPGQSAQRWIELSARKSLMSWIHWLTEKRNRFFDEVLLPEMIRR